MWMIFILIPIIPSPAWGREPSVDEVQQEAIRSIGFDRGEVEGWKGRSRWAAALPRLQVGFERELKDVVALTTRDNVSVTGGDVFIGPDENNFDQNFNQGTSFDVKAVWYLNELVFSRDSLAASGERRDWIRERTRALQEVTEAYFTRKRLLQELLGRRDSPEIREKKKLFLDQVTATIDAWTGGWFSREVER